MSNASLQRQNKEPRREENEQLDIFNQEFNDADTYSAGRHAGDESSRIG